MNERKELFDTLKEQNHTARSARTAVGGKKRYMLPSDRMSASEIEKMNGEIVVYEMKKPISWAKFKGYPKDVQREYLRWFVDEFGATTRMMASVFNLSDTYIYKALAPMGLNTMLPRSTSVENRAKFIEWLKQYRPETQAEETLVEEPKKEKVKAVEQPMFFNTITGCEMSMEGKASEIGQMLFNLFRDQKIAVNISFVGAKEEAEALEA